METKEFPHYVLERVNERKMNLRRQNERPVVPSYQEEPQGCLCTIIGLVLGLFGLLASSPFLIVIAILLCSIDIISRILFHKSRSDAELRLQTWKNSIEKSENRLSDEYEMYLESFKNNAHKLSTKFANSELTKEIVEVLTPKILEEINSKGKPTYDDWISIPFCFRIHNTAMEFYIGSNNNSVGYYGSKVQGKQRLDFDFREKNIKPLAPLEQVALEIAIGQAIESNIKTKLSPSEINYTVKTSYSYDEKFYIEYLGYVACDIECTAAAVKYVGTREWY